VDGRLDQENLWKVSAANLHGALLPFGLVMGPCPASVSGQAGVRRDHAMRQ
jgi:hypothetical protein